MVPGCTVLASLGVGTSADVWLVERGGRRAALKTYHRFFERAARESACLAAAAGPGVVEQIDGGSTAGAPWLLLEWIDGPDLFSGLGRTTALGPEGRGAWLATRLAELARALDRVHRADVIHRDVKAANVILRGANPVLIDFGIATGPGFTAPVDGPPVGPRPRMSPEQYRGREPLDGRSDVYSIGVLLRDGVRRLGGSRTLPRGMALLDLARRATSEAAGDRPATAALLADELEGLIEG